MSIYISGMVMMPSEDDYVAVVVYGDGTIRSIFGNVIEGATAVPVQPHGRAIDADRLERVVFAKERKWLSPQAIDSFIRDIKHAPTIIPADDPKEE